MGKAELQQGSDLGYGHGGPLWERVSCCSLCLTIWMDGCTGTEVKRALTSFEVMISRFQPFALELLYEVLGVFEVVG